MASARRKPSIAPWKDPEFAKRQRRGAENAETRGKYRLQIGVVLPMQELRDDIVENRLATAIIGAAIEVQRHLGAGLVESAYERALCHEFDLRGLRWQSQLPVSADYKGVLIPDAYRLDLMIENLVVVELKVVEKLLPIHEAQLLTYLRFTGKKLGLLLNFHSTPMKSGVRRVVNGL